MSASDTNPSLARARRLAAAAVAACLALCPAPAFGENAGGDGGSPASTGASEQVAAPMDGAGRDAVGQPDGDATLPPQGEQPAAGVATQLTGGSQQAPAPAPVEEAAPRTSLKAATIAPVRPRRYTGRRVKPKPRVTVNGTVLRAGVDYTLSYRRNRRVGRALVVIRGKGAYTGTRKVSFRIVRAVGVTGLTARFPRARAYTGSAITPGLTLTHKGRRLVEGEDYTVTFERNKKVGTAKAVVRGKGIYKGSRTVTFEIVRRDLKKAHITLDARVPDLGRRMRPKPTVVVGGRTLACGRDYTLAYRDNLGRGTATLTVVGKGGYKGSRRLTFKIVARKSLETAKLSTLAVGSINKPRVTLGRRVLQEGRDYKVTYVRNDRTDMVTATIEGRYFYEGTRTLTYCEDVAHDRLGKRLLRLAKSQLGVPYQRSATEWNKLLDCSGLTYLVYQKAGVDIPRYQSFSGGGKNSQVYVVHAKNWKRRIEDLQPGDIVFYGATWKTTEHVGIYIGDGYNYEAAPGGVLVQKVYSESWHPTWHSFVGGGSPV